MEPLSSLLLAIAVSLLVSTAILIAIVKPLRRVLAMICRSGESTPFWVAFTMVMLYVAPLFLAVFWSPIFDTSLVHVMRTALSAALFGSFVGMIVIGMKIASAKPI